MIFNRHKKKVMDAIERADDKALLENLSSIRDIDFQIKGVGTLLHYAVILQNFGAIKILITHGSSIDVKNENHMTPVELSLYYDDLSIMKFMIDKSDNLTDLSRGEGFSILNVAAYCGNVEIAKYALEKGIDPNLKDEDGDSAMKWACQEGKKDIVTLLASNGAEIDSPDIFGQTPLYKAVGENHLEICEVLIDLGAQVDCEEHTQILGLACAWEHCEIAKMLIEDGANVNRLDEENLSPLYFAVDAGNLDLVKMLLEAGADPNLSIGISEDIYNFAEKKGNRIIVELLESFRA